MKEMKKNIFWDFDFIAVYSSLCVLNNQTPIINRYILEKEIYKIYKNKEYKCVFEDIIKNKEKINDTDELISLGETFDKASIIGLLVSLNFEQFAINISDLQAKAIISKYDEEYINKMEKIFDIVKGKKTFYLLEKSEDSGKMFIKRKYDIYTK